MKRLKLLEQKVEKLYKSNNPRADVWIDWAYDNHVLIVADLAAKLAKEKDANLEFVVAGSLLHDIADAVMARRQPRHEAESMDIADTLLKESGFGAKEIEYILSEIIKPHSCRDQLPRTLDGKVMATADSAAHFMTDFYPLFCWRHYGPRDDYRMFRQWVAQKIEKDYHKKIFFEDVKKALLPRYEAVRLLFTDDAPGATGWRF